MTTNAILYPLSFISMHQDIRFTQTLILNQICHFSFFTPLNYISPDFVNYFIKLNMFIFPIIIEYLGETNCCYIGIFNYRTSCIMLLCNFVIWKTALCEIRSNISSLKIVEESTIISNP